MTLGMTNPDTSNLARITIDSAFDGGNIRLMAIDGDRIDLEIVTDHGSDFYQWFSFRVAGARGRRLTFRILNAGGSAYPDGWPGYRVRISTDREVWHQGETRYDAAAGELSFDVNFGIDTDLVWFAYFAPYTLERHNALIARFARHPAIRHHDLGRTLDGRALDLLTIGGGAKPVWLFARQHPGESMAEWWMEGALDWLTGDSALARTLLAEATVHLVPNMNPDGSVRGHLRTNAAGVNLNREWQAPSAERSPEVLHVLRAMDETGVKFAIDVHGDEAIPANFLAGFEGIPSWDDGQYARFLAYRDALATATPDFQTRLGYAEAAPGQANLTMATNQLAERFGAVAMTLEMPFKDHEANPDPAHGWSPNRSRRLAVACLETLAQQIGTL